MYKRLFHDEPPKGHKTPLDQNNHPELYTSEILDGHISQWWANFNRWLLWGDLPSILM